MPPRKPTETKRTPSTSSGSAAILVILMHPQMARKVATEGLNGHRKNDAPRYRNAPAGSPDRTSRRWRLIFIDLTCLRERYPGQSAPQHFPGAILVNLMHPQMARKVATEGLNGHRRNDAPRHRSAPAGSPDTVRELIPIGVTCRRESLRGQSALRALSLRLVQSW